VDAEARKQCDTHFPTTFNNLIVCVQAAQHILFDIVVIYLYCKYCTTILRIITTRAS
jgi:hypothetical protein